MRRLPFSLLVVAAGIVAGCGATPVATPSPYPSIGQTPGSSSTSDGDVLTYRGDSRRSGLMPGPAPASPPTLAWQFEAGARIEMSPILVEGKVIVVTGAGVVSALDVATGTKRWSAKLGAAVGTATPLALRGVVVIGDRSGTVHSLDSTTGTVRWTTRLDGPIGGSAVAVDARILTATEAGSAYALDPANGAVLWQRSLPGGVSRSVAASDDTLYVGTSGGELTAIATVDGTPRWHTKIASSGECGTPTVVDDLVFDATGIDAPEEEAIAVVAVDASAGNVRWRYANAAHRQTYTPAVVGGRAYVVSEDSSVVALDVETGHVVWSTTTESPVEALPVVVGDEVIVATNGQVLEALDRASGSVLWKAPIIGVPYGPTVSHGLVLVGTSTGTLFAFGTYQP